MTESFAKELKELKYVSMADFCTRIDNIKDMDDKIAFATEYLLSHENNLDYSLDEAINVARMKLADAVAEYNEMKVKREKELLSIEAFPEVERENTIDLTKYGNVENNDNYVFFMTRPDLYLRFAGRKKVDDFDVENNNLINNYNDKINKYNENLRILNGSHLNLNITEQQNNYLHIVARLESKFGGVHGLEEAYVATKPSFFAKLFNTTSIYGKNLDSAFKNFNDMNSQLYGNKEALERAANAYLTHIFPNYKAGYPLIDQSRINQLSGTQKTRVILCNGILDAIRKENKIVDIYSEAIDNNNNRESNFEFDETNNSIEKQNIDNLDKDLSDDSFSVEDEYRTPGNNNNNNIENESEFENSEFNNNIENENEM